MLSRIALFSPSDQLNHIAAVGTFTHPHHDSRGCHARCLSWLIQCSLSTGSTSPCKFCSTNLFSFRGPFNLTPVSHSEWSKMELSASSPVHFPEITCSHTCGRAAVRKNRQGRMHQSVQDNRIITDASICGPAESLPINLTNRLTQTQVCF